jgi:hypothetical protein
MKSVVAAFGLVAGLVACSGKKEADQMTKYADAVCACKTVECAEKIMPEIQKWTDQNAGKEVDKAQADRYNAQIDRTTKCLENLEKTAPAKEPAKEEPAAKEEPKAEEKK